MARDIDFTGTTAVVTGGASGIGRGIAEAFLSEGANVVIADRETEALERTAAELGVLGVQTDVTDPDSVEALGQRVLDEYGEVHVVCNNAGVGPFGSFADMTLDDWRFVLDVNLWGVIHGITTFLPLLARNSDWGHIVNTSSMSVFITPPDTAAYVASKAAVLALTEALNAELLRDESRVGATAVMPGAVRTNIKHSLRTRTASGPTGLRNVDLAASGRAFEWLEPIDVGRMIVDSVRENRPYLFTNSSEMPHVDRRTDALKQGVSRLAPSPSASPSARP